LQIAKAGFLTLSVTQSAMSESWRQHIFTTVIYYVKYHSDWLEMVYCIPVAVYYLHYATMFSMWESLCSVIEQNLGFVVC